MKILTKEQKKEIINVLQSHGVTLPCPRCGTHEFLLSGGYFLQTIQTELAETVIGGPSIPSIVTVCKNCGFISQHAMGRLGLLPKKKA